MFDSDRLVVILLLLSHCAFVGNNALETSLPANNANNASSPANNNSNIAAVAVGGSILPAGTKSYVVPSALQQPQGTNQR
jgi:hypothetical protein